MTQTDLPAAQGVRVAETGLGRYEVEARVGDLTFLVDEPVSAGGMGSGPGPYDLLSAALGACTAMTLRLYAERKGWPLRQVDVEVVHARPALTARDHFSCQIKLDGDLDTTQTARLLEIANRCPVHLTLVRGSDVETSLRPTLASPDTDPVAPQAHVLSMKEAVDEADGHAG